MKKLIHRWLIFTAVITVMAIIFIALMKMMADWTITIQPVGITIPIIAILIGGSIGLYLARLLYLLFDDLKSLGWKDGYNFFCYNELEQSFITGVIKWLLAK